MSKDFFKTRPNLQRLETGDSPLQIVVESRRLWNYSGLLLKPRETYLIEVSGNQSWTDFFIKSDANGYPSRKRYMKKAEDFRRHRPSNWMALIGSINHKYDFFIGKKGTYSPVSEGELILYANGSIDWYWTHWGQIQVTIQRLS